MYPLIRGLKTLLYALLCADPSLLHADTPADAQSVPPLRVYQHHLARLLSLTLSDLYTRWARRPFGPAALFEVPAANTRAMRAALRQRTPLAAALLRAMPWAVQFYERLVLFRETITKERYL